MKRGDQEHDTQGRDGDSLEDAQRTGLEAELVLGVERIGQEGYAGGEAGEIGQATIFKHAKIFLGPGAQLS
jgi:hypothetical protein